MRPPRPRRHPPRRQRAAAALARAGGRGGDQGVLRRPARPRAATCASTAPGRTDVVSRDYAHADGDFRVALVARLGEPRRRGRGLRPPERAGRRGGRVRRRRRHAGPRPGDPHARAARGGRRRARHAPLRRRGDGRQPRDAPRVLERRVRHPARDRVGRGAPRARHPPERAGSRSAWPSATTAPRSRRCGRCSRPRRSRSSARRRARAASAASCCGRSSRAASPASRRR